MEFKLNEKNYATVMHHINTFFKNDAKKDLGIKKVEDGVETINIDGESFDIPRYVEKQVFQAFTGTCHEHYIRKEDREKAKAGEYRFHKDLAAKVLLAVSGKYSVDCIPLEIGDKVILKGSQLILKRKEPFGSWSTTKFISSKNSQEDIEKEMKRGMYNWLQWFTDLSMMTEMVSDEDSPAYSVCDINNIGSEISSPIYVMVEEFNLNAGPIISKHFTYNDLDFDTYVGDESVEFDVSIDTEKVKAGNISESFTITVNGKSNTNSIDDVVLAFMGNTDEEENEEGEGYEY